MTRAQRLAEQAADAAAERARRARSGQRIYRQTLAQVARFNALVEGNKARAALMRADARAKGRGA